VLKAIEFFAAMDESELSRWNRGANDYSEEIVKVGDIKDQYRRMFGRGGTLKRPEP